MTLSHRTWRHCFGWLTLVWALGFSGVAAAQMPARDFDHLRTGFALSGAHVNTPCESCHVGGLFKGTPRDCESCHVAGARLARHGVVKGASHFPTQQSCESCHNTRVFSGARMNHGGVVRGTCSTCHNGVQASGKTASHMATTASCDSCHGNNAWRPVNHYDHTGVAPGSCASCHNGSRATGPGASHTPYLQVAAIASAGCDTCHRSGFRSWTPARLHGSVSVLGQCGTCHLSQRPADALHAAQTACETCHKGTSTWSGARVDHNSFTAATVCSSCHNGSSAGGKNATHVPTGATNCSGCHGVTTWKPSRFNHTQVPVTAQCASCHSGSYPPADGKPANHLPYQLVSTAAAANCDSCHKSGYSAWSGARLHANVTVGNQCKACHNGSYSTQGADGKPANHVPEAQLLNGGAMECNACHKSITSWSQTMNHNNSLGGGAGWCKACHASGTNFLGGMEKKSLTHERKTPAAIDCSESGCHRPLGNKGVTFSKWD